MKWSRDPVRNLTTCQTVVDGANVMFGIVNASGYRAHWVTSALDQVVDEPPGEDEVVDLDGTWDAEPDVGWRRKIPYLGLIAMCEREDVCSQVDEIIGGAEWVLTVEVAAKLWARGVTPDEAWQQAQEGVRTGEPPAALLVKPN